MKLSHQSIAIAIVLLSVSSSTTAIGQELPTTGSIETRLGKIELVNGYPAATSVERIFDDIDYQRACQAYLWALPLMAMQQ